MFRQAYLRFHVICPEFSGKGRYSVYVFQHLQKCFHIRAALDGPLLLRPTATWQGHRWGLGWRGGWRWLGRFSLPRKRTAGRPLGLHVPPLCCHPSPCDPIKWTGTQSKPTCSKFSKTASMMACKSSLPPSPNQSKRGDRGVITKGLVLGNVRAFVILNSVPRWEKAAPSFLENNFGSMSNKHLNHMLLACFFILQL